MTERLADPFIGALVEASVDPFFILGLDWRIRLANKGGLKDHRPACCGIAGNGLLPPFYRTGESQEVLATALEAGAIAGPLKISGGSGKVFLSC